MIMELSNYATMFKALSNEQRLKIFLIIYNRCCVPESTVIDPEKLITDPPCCSTMGSFQKAFSTVCDCLNLSRSTISHHFKELQNAGLISCEREGQSFRCSVNEEAISALRKFLGDPDQEGQK